MTPHVHQLWIGSDMPAREKSWCAGIRAASERAGLPYRLWLWGDLLAEFAGDAVIPYLKAAYAFFPSPGVSSFISDYFRFRLLAHAPGFYLDTDFIANGDMPSFDSPAEFIGLTESWSRRELCTGFMYSRTTRPGELAYPLAGSHMIERLGEPDAPEFKKRLLSILEGKNLLTAGPGPAWFRRAVLPVWKKAGVSIDYAPRSLVGHRQWQQPAALMHYGAGSWFPHRAASAEIWQKKRHEAMAAQEPGLARTARVTLPSIPKKELSPPPTEAAALRSMMPLPRGVQRIIIFSNVADPAPLHRLCLSRHDLCIHLNKARRIAEAASSDCPHHWLLVRRGDKHWYANAAAFDLCSRIFFINAHPWMKPFPWYASYPKALSPTTGFTAANTLRAIYPHIPIVLHGFDPLHPHGSPRWEGHAWAYEAEALAKSDFQIIPPAEKPELFILIASCHAYAAPTTLKPVSEDPAARRAACRDTWLSSLPPAADYAFYAGEAAGTVEPDVWSLPAPDAYRSLPAKTLQAIKKALTIPTWKWLYKCDDDTYLNTPALLAALPALAPPDQPTVLGCIHPTRRYASGGAGYVLTRAAAQAIIDAQEHIPPEGAEDLLLTRAAADAGAALCHDSRFHKHPPAALAPDPSAFSYHYISPASMPRLHKFMSAKP